MFEPMIRRPIRRPVARVPVRGCPRISTLLLLILCIIPAAGTRAASTQPRPAASRLQSAEPRGAGEGTALEVGKPVECELSGGQRRRYRFALREGQYAVVTVEQRGVDVAARLFGADGQLLATVDSRKTADGSEKVELVAAVSGDHVIEVEPSLPKAGAGRCLVHLSEVREATPDERLLHEARRQFYESLRLGEAGKYDAAVELASRALETRERLPRAGGADVAASLLGLGTLYLGKGDAARAEPLLRRAAEVTAKASGAESLDYADVLHVLARARVARGDSVEAERLNRQALAIREKAAGPDSLAAAASLLSLAILHRAANDLPEAEKALQRTLAIRERLLGADHIEVANALNNLGLLYYGAGDYDGAEPIFRRSLSIREKALGPGHTQVGASLNNLGLLEWKRGDYVKAEGYYRRALGIFEKADGPESYGVANSLHNLGIVYKESGRDYVKAEEHYQRALAILEKLYGENHENTINCLTSLGILRQAAGDYEGAERYYRRALDSYEKGFGPYNTGTIRGLRSLARLYAAKGDVARAVEYQGLVGEREEKVTRLNLTLGSEKQKLAYFTQLQRPDRVISLHVGLAPGDGAARDAAAALVLQRKGRVLDALSGGLSALRQRFNAQDQALLTSLDEVTSRLARLILGKPRGASPEEHQSQIKALEQEREKLEAEIGRRSAGFYEAQPPVTLESVRAAVPPEAALVEFAVYRPYDWKAAEEKTAYGEPRYVAYVIRNRGEVRWAELGPAAEIDKAVEALRRALRDPLRRDVREVARAADEKVMRPVRALAGDAGRLLISPDGALNLIPFEALVDERGGYLVERYPLTYLSSGRDLLRMSAPRRAGGRAVVIADPAFGNPPVVASAGRGAGGGARLDYSQVFFGPLPGVGDEVRALRGLLPGAEFLTGARATKAAVKRVRGPSILHIATHGFFLQSDPRPPARETARAGDTTRLGKWVVQVDDPLLRSGLALAGANSSGPAGSDDGVLTALEMAQLDLRGTKLVVLSACDTGVGEVRSGEGVYGLRRALALAGAESQLMSLWPVSDRSTRDLMIGYYEGLTRNLGRGEALRQVQLRMLRGGARNHPYYWASFIQTGEWADLRGVRR
jgi:CHAT domain-containing protein/tetratricopeptide (TPR) repeat protein